MARIAAQDLTSLLEAAIVAAGASTPAARSLARQTVEAEAFGQANNGVAHLFDYLGALRAGRINGQAQPAITRPTPAILHCDLDGGLPQLGFDLAFDDLVAAARSFGLAVFCSTNGYTCGALGTFAWRLADADLVALAATNGPALLAGSGSTTPVYCTNPLAFAAPQADGPPLLIDQSSSMTAFANIRAAAANGTPIPADWAFDAAGQPTTDPQAAMKGAMRPFGGARGANIALMIEVLAAGVSGANWSLDAPGYLVGTQSPGTGLFVLAVDTMAIDPDFKTRLAAQLKRLAGEHGIHVPGRAKGEAYRRAFAEGLEIGEGLLQRLGSL